MTIICRTIVVRDKIKVLLPVQSAYDLLIGASSKKPFDTKLQRSQHDENSNFKLRETFCWPLLWRANLLKRVEVKGAARGGGQGLGEGRGRHFDRYLLENYLPASFGQPIRTILRVWGFGSGCNAIKLILSEIMSVLEPSLWRNFSVKFDQSHQSRDLFKPCDWSNSNKSSNFTLSFVHRIGSRFPSTFSKALKSWTDIGFVFNQKSLIVI